MREFFQSWLDGLIGGLQLLLQFVMVVAVIGLVSLGFMFIGKLFGDESEPSKYDPADSNQDGIVSEGEMEAYEIDPSVQYGGK